MTPSQEQQLALERSIDRTLRAQPLLKAPSALEARVLSAIQQRATRAWWDTSFMHWPIAARAVFLLACAICVKFVLEAAIWGVASLHTARIESLVAAALEGLRTAGSVLGLIGEVGGYVLQSIPTYWLYAGAIAGVAAYLTFFGLGAAVYRTLYK